ncbi:MAG: hypothetical protein PHG69_03475, partial [Candidatus Omnitrophica bacterium]|nr:hypothetical protein [Candidatus Omnitrophota bacterium]
MISRDILFEVSKYNFGYCKKSHDYLEWINSDLVRISEDFIYKSDVLNSSFAKKMKIVFETQRFELLIKRWVV